MIPELEPQAPPPEQSGEQLIEKKIVIVPPPMPKLLAGFDPNRKPPKFDEQGRRIKK